MTFANTGAPWRTTFTQSGAVGGRRKSLTGGPAAEFATSGWGDDQGRTQRRPARLIHTLPTGNPLVFLLVIHRRAMTSFRGRPLTTSRFLLRGLNPLPLPPSGAPREIAQRGALFLPEQGSRTGGSLRRTSSGSQFPLRPRRRSDECPTKRQLEPVAYDHRAGKPRGYPAAPTRGQRDRDQKGQETVCSCRKTALEVGGAASSRSFVSQALCGVPQGGGVRRPTSTEEP